MNLISNIPNVPAPDTLAIKHQNDVTIAHIIAIISIVCIIVK
jgi:hypothetical protein